MKKGAMFGLDARIALAIFGALSVISGAALYSAIQESRVVKFLTDITELEKSIESYVLDTGNNLPSSSTNGDARVLSLESLITSTVSGWKGPYISYEVATTDYHFSYPDYGVFGLIYSSNEDNQLEPACSAGHGCYYQLSFRDIPVAVKQNLDEKIDGSIDDNSGRVRYSSTHLFYYTNIPYNNY
jgi:hypothetical protein